MIYTIKVCHSSINQVSHKQIKAHDTINQNIHSISKVNGII